jgi:hypothetical protein
MFLPVNITLQFGDTGEFVAELQRRLSLINLFNEAFINATFDSNTVNAVKSFQSMQGLRVDGVAGPETLRRLNGMISGDTSSSSSSSNQEEEQKQAQATALMVDAIFADAQQQAIDPTPMAAPEEKREVPLEKSVAAPPPPPPRSDMPPQETSQQQIDALKQQQLQPTAEELQARLMQQQAEMAKLQEQLKQQQPKPLETAKPAEPSKPKEEQAVAERKPLSAMLQRLVDYVESKLPKSVVDEVKNIGQAMLKAGVREAAMPTETAPRAPELEAARGQQQQQRS